jgi:hypothetical protein
MKKFVSIMGFYHMYPSFNLNMTIDKINEYIDKLYNNEEFSLKPNKLPIDAKNEFNSPIAVTYYGEFTDKSVKPFGNQKTLEILKSSEYYKLKYLKYKKKYLELKKL